VDPFHLNSSSLSNARCPVLDKKQFARRWRDCNPFEAPIHSVSEEDEWRKHNLELLSKAHTLGGIMDLTFEVVESDNAVSSCDI
jgi:hypothetical protein